METIRWSAGALKQLGEIYDYIAADNPDAAGRVVDGINEKVEILLDHPRIGWRHEKIKDREIRIILYGHYRIAYQVEATNEIHVLGIYHAAMSLDKYLK